MNEADRKDEKQELGQRAKAAAVKAISELGSSLSSTERCHARPVIASTEFLWSRQCTDRMWLLESVMTKFKPLLLPTLAGWHMAGAGGFRWAEIGDALESFGGPGLLWYADEVFGDFTLNVEWRVMRPEDNSGVFLRCPALGSDVRPAVENGYEVQIDERGLDPATGRLDCPLHKTGAIYGLAPATGNASLPIGSWNLFEITAKKRKLPFG